MAKLYPKTSALKSVQYTPKDLPTLDEFERALTPYLKELHPLIREAFVLRAYELVKRKQELEMLRANFIGLVRPIGVLITKHKKIITQINCAVQAVELAQELAAPELTAILRSLGVMEAQRLLTEARTFLTVVKDRGLPSFIHPELKKGAKKPVSLKTPAHAEYWVGFGSVKIDHWYIGEIDRLFDTICITEKLHDVKVGRDKIMKAILRIAFNDHWNIERVKSARLSRRRVK